MHLVLRSTHSRTIQLGQILNLQVNVDDVTQLVLRSSINMCPAEDICAEDIVNLGGSRFLLCH